mmetsp:Transcript_25624/g.52175  ORF Transcript_25624/g.52175 Transcript_25624/m.52175 type:complete len:244 (+) Transcript_25624:363-1094(+)
MQPITAIVTPGRWPVASLISAVTVWRSKSVRPHEGHETYSVFVFRMRLPWRRPKEVVRMNSGSLLGDSIRIPSPLPSTSEHPTCEPTVRTTSSLGPSITTWWITGAVILFSLRKLNTRREAWTRLTPSGTLSRIMTGDWSLSAPKTSSDSSPRTEIAMRTALSGISTLPSATFARSNVAMALGSGVLASTSAGARTPTPTSCSRRRAVRSFSAFSDGTSRRKMESVVAMSLNGIPTAVLQPRL